MSAPCDRWQPDENLIDHTRLCPLPITRLSGPDRAWVVAGLTAQGWTAEETARQLKCSLRLIRQIRAEPMYQVARYALVLRDQVLTADVRMADQTRQANRTIAGLQAELRRVTNQRNKLIDKRTGRVPA